VGGIGSEGGASRWTISFALQRDSALFNSALQNALPQLESSAHDEFDAAVADGCADEPVGFVSAGGNVPIPDTTVFPVAPDGVLASGSDRGRFPVFHFIVFRLFLQ
jgi:hypothetical protein